MNVPVGTSSRSSSKDPGTFVPQADSQAAPDSRRALGQGCVDDYTVSAAHGFGLSLQQRPTYQPGRQKLHYRAVAWKTEKSCYFPTGMLLLSSLR